MGAEVRRGLPPHRYHLRVAINNPFYGRNVKVSQQKLAESSLKTLRAGQVMALGSAGGRLEVLHGRVWLTREGDLDDHVVATGESLRIAPNGSATPLAPAAKPIGPARGKVLGGFAAVVAVMLALLALAPLGARRRQ